MGKGGEEERRKEGREEKEEGRKEDKEGGRDKGRKEKKPVIGPDIPTVYTPVGTRPRRCPVSPTDREEDTGHCTESLLKTRPTMEKG